MKKAGRGWWLGICLWALVLGSACPSGALAAICEVGDLSKGYWKMVGAPYKGACIIPGPPHPDSPFLHGNVNNAFRIEGKYKVVTVLTGNQTHFECAPGCITGFSEWMCVGVYGAGYKYEANGQMCWQPDGKGNYVRFACFTDGVAVTLYEWVWTNKDCDKEEPPPTPPNTPNPDPGKPGCPQPPL